MPDEGRGRSHSRHTPTQIVVPQDHRHSSSHRSHHTPAIIQRRRSRSYSSERSAPQLVVMPNEGRGRSHSRHTPTQIVVADDRRHSGSHRSGHTPTIIQRPRSRSYSSEREGPVILTHDPHRRSRSRTSPIVLEGGSRSSHHTSHRPTIIATSQRPRSQSLSPTSRTLMIDRSPSRSSRHHPVYTTTPPRRSRSRSPPIIIGEGVSHSRHGSRPETIYTSHRGRSQSPPPLVVHEGSRHGSRQPSVYATSHQRDRSQSPSSAIMPPLSRHDSGRSRPTTAHTTRRSRSVSPRSAPVYEASRAQTPTIIQVHDDERFPPRTGVLHGPAASPPRSQTGSIFEQPTRPPSSHVSRRGREGSLEPLSDDVDRSRDAPLTRPGTVVPSQGSSRGPRTRSDLTGRREGEVVVPGATPSGPSRRSSPRDQDAIPVGAPSEMQYADGGDPTVIRVRSSQPSRRHTPVSSRDGGASVPRGSHPSDIIPRPPPSDFEDEDHAPTIIPPDGSEAGFPRRASPTRSFHVPEDARGISPPTGSPSPSEDQRDGRTRSQAHSQRSTGGPDPHVRTERPLSDYDGDVPRDEELPPGVRTPEIGGPVRPSSRSVEDLYASAFNDAEDERRMRYTDAEQRRDRLFQEREAARQDTFEGNEQAREEKAEAAMHDILRATRGIISNEPALGEGVPIDVPSESIRSEHTPPGPTASVVPSGPFSVRGEDVSHLASGPATIGPSVRGSSEGGVVPPGSDVGLYDAAHQEALRDEAAAEAEAERGSAAALSETGRSVRSEKAQSEMAESIHSVAQTIAAERASWQTRLEATERERAEMLEILQREHEERVRQLQEEISILRDTREAERLEKEKEEAERREKCEIQALERDAGLRDQLNDITNLLEEKKAECERLQKLNEERESVKEERRSKKDGELEALRDLVQRIVDQNEAIRTQTAEDRIAQEAKPGIEVVLEALEKQKQEQSALFNSMAEGWQSESQKQHQEVLERVKASAHEQVPFNVKEYLEQFSQALAEEVRMLLYEVGKLREEKRNIQFELGTLMCIRSKYGPGGEFDPEWRPNIPMYGGPPGPPPPGGPPPDDGFPPDDRPPPQAKPAWRNVTVQPPAPPKLSKRQKRQLQKEAEEAAAAQQAGPSVQRTSWATWIPNPNLAPTPTSEQAELVAHPPSPGLWGPRESPRNGFKKP